jgi:hypothetical protein
MGWTVERSAPGDAFDAEGQADRTGLLGLDVIDQGAEAGEGGRRSLRIVARPAVPPTAR